MQAADGDQGDAQPIGPEQSEPLTVSFAALDRDGNLAVWDHVAQQVTGYSLAEAQSLEDLASLLRAVPESGNVAAPITTKDERSLRVLWTSVPAFSPDFRWFAGTIVAAGHDRPSKLLHAQKLESLGTLAAGVAHEFNNLLMGIIGNTELALRVATAESSARPHLDLVLEAAQSAAHLTAQLLAYTGHGPCRFVAVNLSALVSEMEPLLTLSVPRPLGLRMECAPALPPVRADVTQLRQVVMNIVSNAAEAMKGGTGVVTVATGRIAVDAAYAQTLDFGSRLRLGQYAYVEVSDNGEGMDSGTRERMFEPFFSSKFTGRGLGLAAVHGIVQSHAGGVKVYTESGRGTTVKVVLPLVETAELPSQSAPHARTETATRTVLVIDDELAIRQVAKSTLEAAGYTVVTASGGQEGLDRFATLGDDVAAVILDLTMPDLGGEEVFTALRRIDPHVRVILSTGYAEFDATTRFAGKGLAGFLQKPYRIDALVALVDRVIRADTGPGPNAPS